MLNTFKKQFQSVFESLRDPLLIVDPTGHIIDFNPAARSSLDIGESEHIRDVTSLEGSFVFDTDQILSLLGRSKPILGFRFKDANGNLSDVAADVINLEARKRGGGLKLVHIKDFSAVKNYERWKDELISMVAHEIKNPLSAMKNSLNILISQATGPVTQEQHKLLTTSMRGIDRLTRLLEGFLDVSRIGTGNYSLEPRWVKIHEFLQDVLTSFKTLFNVQHQRLDYSVAPDIERVYVDAPKLEQVLINLLSNAVKFTPAGGEIRVNVARASLEALNDDLRILPWNDICQHRFFSLTVADSGIGMTGDTLAHLFTRYYRNAEGGGLKGSHLGLSISKTLTEVQNGSLRIESEPGVGTEVTVYLPEDEKTAIVLGRLRSIERCLGNAINIQKGGLFYVLLKNSRDSWREVVRAWPKKPLSNPTIQEERDESFFLWTLSERIAVLLSYDDEDPSSMVALAGGGLAPRTDASAYRIGRCRVPKEGNRLSQLFNTALNRLRFQEPVQARS